MALQIGRWFMVGLKLFILGILIAVVALILSPVLAPLYTLIGARPTIAWIANFLISSLFWGIALLKFRSWITKK